MDIIRHTISEKKPGSNTGEGGSWVGRGVDSTGVWSLCGQGRWRSFDSCPVLTGHCPRNVTVSGRGFGAGKEGGRKKVSASFPLVPSAVDTNSATLNHLAAFIVKAELKVLLFRLCCVQTACLLVLAAFIS